MPPDYTMIIEEIRVQLATTSNSKEKVALSNTLAWQLIDVNPREAIALGQEALALAAHNKVEGSPQLETAQSWLNIGAGYVRLAEYQTAMPFLADAAAVFEMLGNNDGLIHATNGIGIVFLHVGDYASFLEYAFQALSLCIASGNKKIEVCMLNNIGHGYMRQSKYDEALSYLKQSLALSETLGTTIYQADIHDNLCGTLRGMGKYTAAVEHGYRSIALYEQEERLTGKAEAWNNLGDVYLEMGEFDKAVASFRHAYQIAETIGLRFQAVEALLRMGDAWVGQEQYLKAKEVGIDTLAWANDIDSLSLQYQSYFLLFKAAQAMGDLAEALAHHIQYHKFREVVFNQEADARKSALEAVYQVRQAQQETEIYQLKSVELEREVAERNRIAAELQQQNDELQAFAHTVAHDLKSPIALMVGFAEVLQGDVTALAPDMMAQIVQSIASGGHKAAQIIDELLLLAGVRSQQVMPELVDITAVTADAIYQLKTEIEARQGTIVQTNTFPLAVGYAPWIEQVWKNYISNGLKYGGTPPVLTLGFTENVAGMTRFWVQDNGPGLTATEQARLFTEFTRLAHDRANGHGLGLAIVRRIMEKLNGRVGVESVPGEGCLFYFDLPGEGG